MLTLKKNKTLRSTLFLHFKGLEQNSKLAEGSKLELKIRAETNEIENRKKELRKKSMKP